MRIKISIKFIIYLLTCLITIASAMTFVMAKDEEPTSATPAKSNFCVATETATEEIKKARLEIEKGRKELEAKQAELKTREQVISEELKKLEEDRDLVLKEKQGQEKLQEEKVSKLVETFLSMSPKAAAKILSTLDDTLALTVIYQMDTPRLAKIMNLLDPKRSSHLSELLVGLARTKNPPFSQGSHSASNDVAEAIISKMKGGEEKNGNNENDASTSHESQQSNRKTGSSDREKVKKTD